MALLLVVGAPASAVTPGRHSYSGDIEGAHFRVEVPERWTGTLVLFSHPYYTADVPAWIGFDVRQETESWLLSNGYALAASDFKGRTGFAVEHALHDQVALLDWFGTHVGRPRTTVATGASMGAAISIMLAERNPDRFDGVPRGTTPTPVVTLHNVSDVADPANERWYSAQVSESGDPDNLRQLYVGRATHCAFNAAEEISTLRSLLARIDSGRWQDTSPARLNTLAAGFGEKYQLVLDFPTFQEAVRRPAFTSFTPPPALRPSRSEPARDHS